MEAKHIRHNYLAILAAAAACVAFLLVWYEIFLDTWLKAIGHDRIWLASTGVSFGLQCVTALVAAALVAVSNTYWFSGYDIKTHRPGAQRRCRPRSSALGQGSAPPPPAARRSRI